MNAFLAPSMVSEGYAAAVIGLIADLETFQILDITRSAEILFGYHMAGELLGQSVQVLLPEVLRDRHLGHLQDFRDNPSARPMGRDLQLRGRRRDGSTLPLEIALYPRVLGNTRVVVATFFDMSHRHEAAAAP